ncbi:hypothetical protein PINS_up000729 [Pythium insidiosum]|nr:hypothetical protein PINS_up000729 [Pythium insidiosum]
MEQQQQQQEANPPPPQDVEMAPRSRPFPTLELSVADRKEICQIAKQVVRAAVDEYEYFLWADRRQLSPARWSLVQAKDDIRVYHNRQHASSATASTKEAADRQSLLLAVGSLVGSVDDAALGLIARTEEEMRLRARYLQESVTNCAVLAVVQRPKDDKPFRSITVKWVVRGAPWHLRALSKPRDSVFIDATGVLTLTNNERVAFQLVHSIELPQAPTLQPMYTRTRLSHCSLWRQLDATHVETYTRAIIETPDRLTAPLMIRSTAESFLLMWRVLNCAQMKKLAWFITTRTPLLGDTDKAHAHGMFNNNNSSSNNNDNTILESILDDGKCGTCGSASRSVRRRSPKCMCLACGRFVCNECRTKKELFAANAEGEIVATEVVVCLSCLTLAVRTSATDVLRDELAAAQRRSSEEKTMLASLHHIVGSARHWRGSSFGATPRHHPHALSPDDAAAALSGSNSSSSLGLSNSLSSSSSSERETTWTLSSWRALVRGEPST